MTAVKLLLFVSPVLLLGAPLFQSQGQPSAPAELQAAAPLASPITVIAIRHGEKDKDQQRDPHLSKAGQTRAGDLARLLSSTGVTHLFTTPYHRTRETLAPLAEATGIEISEYSPRDLKAFAASLRALPSDSVAVVCGHSNTTPALVLALGGDIIGLETLRGRPALDETDYDRLFITTLAGEDLPVRTLELRYGD
ncbi:MAG: histidine phosphatase family protein [Planctomycetota bacterium]|jgi:phosphohistidine phosphatase SixA|nr:histidine phosphatase family protein [Planctomycetota bacterium]MDP6520716.1 histidine phosphatase family protein [Planctomycetota bacterium]MDP6839391.1 histidine phosphatase family protein [Planctomycetota bacterium]MDP6955714.1 histidine phosphatase family protein [Planctomycetota bacterium]